MGKVRNDTIKRASRELLRRFPDRFTGEWEADKLAVNELVATQSKRLRNRIAGYVITLKIVEAERAKRAAAAPTAAEAEAFSPSADGSAAGDRVDSPGSTRGRGRPSDSGRRRRRRV